MTILLPKKASTARRTIDSSEDDSAYWNAESASSNHDDIHVSWEVCQNPWGLSTFGDDDVVVYSACGRVDQHQSDEPIFCDTPFSASTTYGTTHRAPGFELLVLQRDPSGKLSWGFSYARHEPDGACLISAVGGCSPAASAVSNALYSTCNFFVVFAYEFECFINTDISWNVRTRLSANTASSV
jgi:hypothetical protein